MEISYTQFALYLHQRKSNLYSAIRFFLLTTSNFWGLFTYFYRLSDWLNIELALFPSLHSVSKSIVLMIANKQFSTLDYSFVKQCHVYNIIFQRKLSVSIIVLLRRIWFNYEFSKINFPSISNLVWISLSLVCYQQIKIFVLNSSWCVQTNKQFMIQSKHKLISFNRL